MSSRNTRSSTKRRDKRDKTKREKFAAKKRQKVDAKRREEEHSKDMHATYGTTPVRGVVEDWDDQSRIRNTVISDESISSLEEVSKRESRFREAKSHMTLMSRNPCYNSIIDKNPRRKIDCSSDELRGFAYSNGLPTYGTKEELVDRIRFYINEKTTSDDRASGRLYSFRRSPCYDYSTMVPNTSETIKSKRQIIRSQFRGITNDNWKVKINSFFLERLYTLYDQHFFDNKLRKMISERGYRVVMSWDSHLISSLDVQAYVLSNKCDTCKDEEGFCDEWGSKCHEIFFRFKPTSIARLLESGGSLPSSTAGEPAVTDFLMAIMETFEHELVHVIMTAFCPKETYSDNQGSWKGTCNASTGHSKTFMTILNNIFGHTEFQYSEAEGTEPWNQQEDPDSDDEKTELDVYRARAEYSSQLIAKGKSPARVDAIKSGLLERMKLGLGTFRGQDLSNSALTTPWKEMTSLYTPGIDKDSKASVDLHRSIADQGHMNTQYRVGRFYYDGQGVEKDFETAARYFKMAAEQGHMDAQYKVGILYYDGEGFEQDFETATRYFKMAADQGHGAAQIHMGDHYYDKSKGKKAARYYKMAVDSGFTGVSDILGLMYYLGELDVVQNLNEAEYFFKLSAETDNRYRYVPDRSDILRELRIYFKSISGKSITEVQYLKGQLFNKTGYVEIAIEKYKLAAEGGYAMAHKQLGMIYYFGAYSVDQNLEKATEYFKVAAGSGDLESLRKYNSLLLLYKMANGEINFSANEHYMLGILFRDIDDINASTKHFKLAKEKII